MPEPLCPRERLDKATLIQSIQAKRVIRKRLGTDHFNDFTPNAKQWELMCSWAHENILSGPNQAGGKTETVCNKAVMDLTGRYPKEYTGPRFTHPIVAAIGGETNPKVRDTITDRILGPYGKRGTGIMPADCFEAKDPSKDIINAATSNCKYGIDYFEVKWHNADGIWDGVSYSRCYVFSYKAGWERLSGYTLHAIYLDEEPAYMIYDEFSARLNFTNGYLYIAMTPLLGDTELYLAFEEETQTEGGDGRRLISYDIEDCTHLADGEMERLKKKYKKHPLADARLHGRPVRGVGLIYRTPMEDLWIDDVVIPNHWPQGIGLDFPHTTGAFAAGKFAYDKENDVLYLTHVYKDEGRERPIYAEHVKGIGGSTLPCFWPSDGGASWGSKDGLPLFEAYKKLGLNMWRQSSHFIARTGEQSRSTWAAIEETIDRQATGRFKVFRSCLGYEEERRKYRAADGKIAKNQDDHILNACDKAIMMMRHFEPPMGGRGHGHFVRPPVDFYRGRLDLFGRAAKFGKRGGGGWKRRA